MPFQIAYCDTEIISGKSCFGCDEGIDVTDGPKYISVQTFSRIYFHESCFEYFINAVLEFTRIFLRERQQDNIERKLN